jgi:Leucine-rich repeat (LRR) protein
VSLSLDNNFISELNQVRCLTKLEILSLGHNLIELIPANAFSELVLLKYLNLIQAGNPVKTIQEFAFNTSSIVSLSLSGCNTHFGKMNASAISKLFSTSPALEILDLGENYLPRDPFVLLAMISQPKKLKQLNINTARLHNLPKNVFLHLKNLEKLVLY